MGAPISFWDAGTPKVVIARRLFHKRRRYLRETQQPGTRTQQTYLYQRKVSALIGNAILFNTETNVTFLVCGLTNDPFSLPNIRSLAKPGRFRGNFIRETPPHIRPLDCSIKIHHHDLQFLPRRHGQISSQGTRHQTLSFLNRRVRPDCLTASYDD